MLRCLGWASLSTQLYIERAKTVYFNSFHEVPTAREQGCVSTVVVIWLSRALHSLLAFKELDKAASGFLLQFPGLSVHSALKAIHESAQIAYISMAIAAHIMIIPQHKHERIYI